MSIFVYDLRSTDGIDHNSGSISNVYYNSKEHRLGVEFHSGFNVYVYEDVPESVYNLFVEADSLNAFYRSHIKGGDFGTATAYQAVTAAEEETTQAETKTDWADQQAWSAKEEPKVLVDSFRFTIAWKSPDFMAGAVNVFETQAANENDALIEFNKQAEVAEAFIGRSTEIKIVSVTRYFE